MNLEPFARVALNLPLHEAYFYRVPESLQAAVEEGALVKVHLRGREEIGCVIGFSEKPGELDPERILPVESRVSGRFRITAEIIELCRFVSEYYLCSVGEALAAASVIGFKDVNVEPPAAFGVDPAWEELAAARGIELTPKQEAALGALSGLGSMAKSALAEAAGCGVAVIKKLLDIGLIRQAEGNVEFQGVRSLPPSPHSLTAEQQSALDSIGGCIQRREFRCHLLHGITGSGKTEVYLRAMQMVLEAGGTALCLVPEISLTPQTVARFEHRFPGMVGVFHSQLTRREKLLVYQGIQNGSVRILIGPRSAVFAPLPRLGLIVIDEEHDGSYKQGETPRYHARDVAIVRAQRLGIPVVLGSATPSLESFHNARTGKYHLLGLPMRAGGGELPPVRVIDLAELATHNPTISLFSPNLVSSIRDRMARGEQSILFLNRRGFSNFLFCPSCKWVARCDDDDVALTVHQRRGPLPPDKDEAMDLFEPRRLDKVGESFLKCHMCGHTRNTPRLCPECEADDLISMGAGTQRVEQEITELLPNARVLRMDYDTVSKRTAFDESWRRILAGDVDVILGTQMIAKGLHLPRVTLVGVVLADVGLFLPDFRAEERTFALLTQVAGRSGRVGQGEVIFQTYMPNHSAIRFAMAHDYEGFFAAEMRRRNQLGFPPVQKLVSLTVSDPDRDKAFAGARLLASILWRLRNRPALSDCRISGPTAAPLARLAGRFRFRILVRGQASRALGRLVRDATDDKEFRLAASARLAVDVDPLDLL